MMKSTHTTVNRFNKVGNTPLIEACQEANHATIQKLLHEGANPNIARKSDGSTPLLIIADAEGEQALTAAEALPIMKDLIQAGANVNQGDNDGKTPLMCARMVAQTDMLIQAGANVNQADKQGKTALMYAAERGDIETVKSLINAGADALLTDKNGYTAQDYAIGINLIGKLKQNSTPITNEKLSEEAAAIVQILDDSIPKKIGITPNPNKSSGLSIFGEQVSPNGEPVSPKSINPIPFKKSRE